MSYVPAAKMPHALAAANDVVPEPPASGVPTLWLALGGFAAGIALALLASAARR